jgi:DNA-binding NtrC family response regulator
MALHHLLIIDDEPEILNVLSRVLHDRHSDIKCGQTAQEALTIVDNSPVDLIICDYMLGPGLNGVQLLEKITKKKKDIICILLTGYADIKIAMEAINTIGLYKFILKPWDNDELIITVRRALEQRDLILENRHLAIELKQRQEALDLLEKENPGITKIKRDKGGRIILD